MLLNKIFAAFDRRGLAVRIIDSRRDLKMHHVTIAYDGPRDPKKEIDALSELGGWLDYEIAPDTIALTFARRK